MPQAKVLLVAHSPLVREGLRHLLANDTLCIVGEEQTLPRALSLLRALDQTVDLVLYDDENQDNACTDLVTIRDEFPQIALVILTAEVNSEDLDEAIRAGVRGILPRSISGKALDLTLQLLLLQKDLMAGPVRRPKQPGLTSSPTLRTGCNSHPDLSRRETDILKLIRNGASNKQIARSLNLAEATVKVHMKSLMRKIEADNRTQAAVWAMNQGPCYAPDDGGGA